MAVRVLTMPRLTVTVTSEQCDWVDERKRVDGVNASQVIRAALDYYREAVESGEALLNEKLEAVDVEGEEVEDETVEAAS